MTTTTDTAVRYTVEHDDNGWHVVASDGNGWHVASRQAGRDLVKQLREGTAPEATEPEVTPEPATEAPEPERTGPSPEVVQEAVAKLQDELTRNAEGIAAVLAEPLPGEDATEPEAEPAAREKLDRDRKITLARVVEGDQLMTNLHGDGEGNVAVQPHRFTDGQVRTVATIGTRKAEQGEMPGTLYRLVFSDGTTTDERYGTTSHYLAPGFTRPEAPTSDGHYSDPGTESVVNALGGLAAPTRKQAQAAKKAAKKAPAKATPAAKAPKIDTTPSRAGKLAQGSRLVLRDLGVVTVDQVSKTGDGKLEVAYTQADGEAGVREMWASTNVRVAAS